MRRSKYVGVALVGLFVVAAISVAAASGRKPPTEQRAAFSSRHVSTSEAMDILREFPELIPGYLASRKDDAEYMAGMFGFLEVTAAPLARIFPTTRFYIGHDFTTATNPYLMAIAGDKRYMMPDEFNRLLFDFGLKVTDKSIIELAEAFVIIAIGGERGSFPEVAFLSETKTKLDAVYLTDAARLKVRIGTQTEEWHFYVQRNQFAGASSVSEKGIITDFHVLEAKSPPGRGQLIPGSPSMAIHARNTDSIGNAYVQYENEDSLHVRPHYYVIVKEYRNRNARDTVVFSVSGFPETTNVWVRVRDSIRHADRWLDKVQMSSDSGRDTWVDTVGSTGICWATAGYAQDSNPHGTYQPIASGKELTPEGVIGTLFPGTGTQDTLMVFYCDQFFRHPPQDSEQHAGAFARYVDSGMIQSWRTQVNTWGLDTPPDADHKHQVFVNDGTNWYHAEADSCPFSLTGPDRKIGIPSLLRYNYPVCGSYSSESILVATALAHEFYHGIQWGISSSR